jgi:hypothetical protein
MAFLYGIGHKKRPDALYIRPSLLPGPQWGLPGMLDCAVFRTFRILAALAVFGFSQFGLKNGYSFSRLGFGLSL